MIDRLKDFAVKKGYDLARAKGVHCPQCSKRLILPPVMPKEGLDATYRCSSCEWSGRISDVLGERRSRSGGSGGVVVEKPAKTKIVEAELDGGKSWLVPPKKGMGFLLFFGIFWMSIVGLITFVALFGDAKDADTGEPVSNWMFLFLLPFWLVGIGTIYGGLRMRYTEVMVLVDGQKVRMLKRFFNKVKETVIDRDEVDSVRLKESYRSNDTPVYAVHIAEKGGGKGLSFGSELRDDEKRWLVSSIQQVLPSSRKLDFSGSMQVASSAEREEFEHKGMKLERIGSDGFRFSRKNKGGLWAVLFGLIFVVVSVLCIRDGMKGFDTGHDSWFDLIFSIFGLIPLVVGTLFGLIGLIVVVVGLASLRRTEVFEFCNETLEVETHKRGVKVKSKTYSRESFSSVDSKNSGHVNNSPRFRVMLKGAKRVKLCSFVPEEVAADLQAWVEGWLIRQPEQSSSGYGEAMKA